MKLEDFNYVLPKELLLNSRQNRVIRVGFLWWIKKQGNGNIVDSEIFLMK